MGRDGSVLDPTPIPITTAPADQVQPAVAFGGGSFLVTWSDSRTGAFQNDIVGARVDPDGSVLDPDGITISSAPSAQVLPDVAFGGGRFLVTWEDGSGPFSAVFGARVNGAGRVLDPAGIHISTEPFHQRSPDVAFNGSHFLVAWIGQRLSGFVVSAMRVNTSGALLDPADLTILDGGAARIVNPTVAAAGPTFLVTWTDTRAGDSYDVAGARIGSDGTNLDPTAPVLWSAVSSQFNGEPALTLGSDGSAFFAAWRDDRLGTPAVFADGVRADGSVVGPGTLLPRAASDQRTIAIGFDGTNHLVVWSDNRSGIHSEVLAARISPEGRMLDPSPMAVSGGLPGRNPAVTFDGEYFVVVWIAGGPVAARVHPSGFVAGRTNLPVVSGAAANSVDVASNGSTSLITWDQAGRDLPRIRAARMSSDGELLDPVGIDVAYNAAFPRVASDGTDFLLAWPSLDGIRASRFRADGTVIGPAGFLVAPSPASVGGIAWNGRRYLFVWAGRGVGPTSDIAGARVTREGVLEDPAGITIAAGVRWLGGPVVASTGRRFLVVWRQIGSGELAEFKAARVGDDGGVVDPTPVGAASSIDDRNLKVSAGPDGSWGIAYTRFVPEAPYGSSRAFFRTVSPK